MSATNSSTWPGSYLFAPEFKPTDDLLTVDADDKFWYYYKDDVSTAQHVLAQARDTKHSSSPGTVKLLRVINQCHDGRQKQDLAAVLDVCQQVSSCRTGFDGYWHSPAQHGGPAKPAQPFFVLHRVHKYSAACYRVVHAMDCWCGIALWN
jgi:hypothetical protein